MEKVEAQIPEMDRHLAEGNFDALKGEAHSIKGGAWNLTAKRLGDAAAKAEEAAREARGDDARAALNEIRAEYEIFSAYARKLLARQHV